MYAPFSTIGTTPTNTVGQPLTCRAVSIETEDRVSRTHEHNMEQKAVATTMVGVGCVHRWFRVCRFNSVRV